MLYRPHKSDTIDKVQKNYTALSNQINQQAENDAIIPEGDVNAKLEIDGENFTQTVSRDGIILTNIISDNNLTPANLKAEYWE